MNNLEVAKDRRAQGVAQLLEQVARRVLEKRGVDDLHAAQWSALRYFSRAGRRASNVAGLAKYLGNTSGPASRTAKSLVDRGLLSTAPSPHDARSVVFSLTETGRETLLRDPISDVGALIEPLEIEDIARLSEYLEYIFRSLETERADE